MSAAAQADCLSPAAEARQQDLRQHQRIMCVDGGVLRLAVRPEFRGRRALMLDISSGGIGFILEEPLPPGTALVFDLQNAVGLETVGRLARVRHCRPHPTPPDAPWLPATPGVSKFFRRLFRIETPQAEAHSWFVGCEFDRPLSDAELKLLIERLQSAL